jgi:hypothetical protein
MKNEKWKTSHISLSIYHLPQNLKEISSPAYCACHLPTLFVKAMKTDPSLRSRNSLARCASSECRLIQSSLVHVLSRVLKPAHAFVGNLDLFDDSAVDSNSSSAAATFLRLNIQKVRWRLQAQALFPIRLVCRVQRIANHFYILKVPFRF